MEGKINGTLVIRSTSAHCELDGLMERGPAEE
jgi:hypothetical protein